MARVSRAQAEQHREEIAEVAARLFRERGLGGVSIAELTAAAGLTHGGFYGHFASKDDLAAEAVSRAFHHSEAKWRQTRAGAADPQDALATIIRRYLRTAQRDDPGLGCASGTLLGDIAREPEGKPVRAVFAEGIDGLVDALATFIGEADPTISPGQARPQAMSLLATLAGAVALARATKGTTLSDEILDAVRQSLGVDTDKE